MAGWWIFYIFLRILQGVLAVVFNLVTIVAVLRYQYLRSYTLVVSLAISDLLHGIIILVLFPLRVFFLTDWPYFGYLCNIQIRIELIMISVQYAMFALISVERWKSMRAQIGLCERGLSRSTTLGLAISTWAACVFSALLLLIGQWEPERTTVCSLEKFVHKAYVYGGAIQLTLTLSITSFFYGWITKIALKSMRNVAPTNIPNSSQIRRRKAEVRMSMMMASVVLLYFILYIPYTINAINLKPDSTTIHHTFKYIFISMFDINFWINPIIYAWRDHKFKKAFTSLFKRFSCFQSTPDLVRRIEIPKPRIFHVEIRPSVGHDVANEPTLCARVEI